MAAVCLAPVYLLLNFYVMRRSLTWLGCCNQVFEKKWFKIVYTIVYFVMATSILTAFFFPMRWLKHISNLFLGTFIYMLIFVAVGDLIRLILTKMGKLPNKKDEPERYRKSFAIGGAVVLVAIVAMSTYGTLNAKDIKINPYEVTIDKSCGDLDSLNIVLIADLHLGYSIGCDMMEDMVAKVNAQNPDLVVVAGDIYDNQYAALEDPDRLAQILSGIESKYGVYACYGNHDIEEPILAGFTFGGKGAKTNDERLAQFIADSNIKLLTDETVLIDDDFYLVGRRDYERPGNEEENRLSPEEILSDLDKTKPIIVIDHEPRELQELADAGADLDLCGHTHDGQVWPGNWTINLFWENACGYLLKDDMHNIVTSGVGLFGPNMRTFTDSEICPIKVNFKS